MDSPETPYLDHIGITFSRYDGICKKIFESKDSFFEKRLELALKQNITFFRKLLYYSLLFVFNVNRYAFSTSLSVRICLDSSETPYLDYIDINFSRYDGICKKIPESKDSFFEKRLQLAIKQNITFFKKIFYHSLPFVFIVNRYAFSTSLSVRMSTILT